MGVGDLEAVFVPFRGDDGANIDVRRLSIFFGEHVEPFDLVEGAAAKGPRFQVVGTSGTGSPASFAEIHRTVLVIPNEAHVASFFVARSNRVCHFGDVGIGVKGKVEAVVKKQIGPQIVEMLVLSLTGCVWEEWFVVTGRQERVLFVLFEFFLEPFRLRACSFNLGVQRQK